MFQHRAAHRPSRPATVTGLGLAWCLTALLAWPGTSLAQTSSADDALPINEIQAFSEVFERIKRGYVEEVDDATLLKNAMRGMLSELDPHSSYLDEDAFRNLRETTQGEFGGIGIEVGLDDGQLTVITPIDDTPAQRAGLEARDAILRIDDTPTDRLTLQEAVDMMRGDPGTDIRLTVVGAGDGAPREVTLSREIIRTDSVKSDVLEPGYGYLRISQFQSRTGEQVEDALAELRDEGAQSGIVLDLRNNPGGVLQSAVDVADAFLDRGLIVYTEGRLADSDMSFSATRRTVAPDVPLVILINGGSASAAEIVAGALQDQRRGVVMGTESFGKGSVQQILPLGNGEGLKLTTALYYTPNGRSIQAQGIEPDVEVVRGRLEVAESSGLRIREADLQGHLGEDSQRDRSDQSDRLAGDYQLGEALNLLKALNVISQRTPQ
ncbi:MULTISPECIES: S41 family peptidase [Halomonas]|uniref:S41 family peptidase n=1 Tax=Halomonas TaxID=2745 RepID=UPI001A8E3399|nr:MULTISPECIES: S41 family peptidase [Halomonas]MEE3214869.1 S41 family peptidase [Pseudomonadota bacterium]MBN8412837.1 S41 family peptidase [Halomonas litopenaei]MBY5925132.1 S41 family peptidase [Halomonas sp. DP4Y7-2]MBY5968049.1 S41 family peptidase [Halomonas denitrificans]MBY5983551.1 S41 family peptidase [Halomonas sp. DP5Y7-2]